MANDLIQFGESKQTMSSLEIAKLTGKPHNDVMKAIRAMEPSWEKVSQGKFSLSSRKVEQPNGGIREYPCYELTKTECLYVATKFNDEARAKLVLRWEELEQKQRAQMLQLPDFTDPAEAAMAWAKEYKEKKVLAIENKKLEEEARKPSEYEGGSMEPMDRNLRMTDLVRKRIEELKTKWLAKP